MSCNLRQQLRTEVHGAFREHLDKHSIKAAGGGEDLIFSYSTKYKMLDVINNFCAHTPDLPKRKEELTKDDINRFLEGKAEAGCTQKTLDGYRSDLARLGRILGVDLNVDKVESLVGKAADRGAESVISKHDLDKLITYAKEHPSRTGVCIQLEALVGVRVSDMAYGTYVDGDILKIKSKNGKWCYRQITPAVRSVLETPEAKKMIAGENGKMICPKDGSINRWLNRVEDKLGMERHSFHDIRRRIAQDCYDVQRKRGCTREEAIEKTSEWLNHIGPREKMIRTSYISDLW